MAVFKRKLYKNPTNNALSLSIPKPAAEAIGLEPGGYALIEDLPERGVIQIRPVEGETHENFEGDS